VNVGLEPEACKGVVDRLTVGLSLLVFAAVWLAELTRQLGTPSWDTIWAEDGTVFLNGAWNAHFLHSLTTPDAGYLEVVPRLLAQVVVVFPVAEAATVTALFAAAVAASASALVFVASAEAIRSLVPRLIVALAPAIASVSGPELLANFANLHWYLIFASFWALIWRKTTWPSLMATGAVLAAATLSDPLTGLYAPLAIALCAYRRRAADFAMLGVLALGSAVQFAYDGNRTTSAPVHGADLASIFGYHVTASLLFGDRFVPELWAHLGYALIVATTVVIGAGLVWALRRSGRPARIWMSTAILYSLGFFVAPMLVRGTAPVWPPVSPAADSRYFFLPVLFIVAAFCIGLDGVNLAIRGEDGWRWPCLFLLGWAGLVTVLNYGIVNGRSAGPSWRDQVRVARTTCSSRAVTTVQLVISPGPPWTVLVPCRDLR
jgi:hypothetical protein